MMEKKSKIINLIERQLINTTKDYVNAKIKKKILKVGEVSVLIILGFILISFGMSYLIGYYFPIIGNGLNFILFGIILLIMGLLKSK